MDGLDYLTSADLTLTFETVAEGWRPAGWRVFDLHTGAMLDHIGNHRVIDGQDGSLRFAIRSVVHADRRECVYTIEVVADSTEESFFETHRQFFHAASEVRAALADAGFVVQFVGDEYTQDSVSEDTMRATWVARRA